MVVQSIDLRSNSITSIAGNGRAGFSDGQAAQCQLSEPSGFTIGEQDTVYISDTNNHVIRRLRLSTGNVTTVQLQGVPAARLSPDTEVNQALEDATLQGQDRVSVRSIQVFSV